MRNTARIGLVMLAGASLAACATPRYAVDLPSKPNPSLAAPTGQKVGKPYQIGGVWYVPREQPDYDEVGVASWYGPGFHLKTTATGEIFDMDAVTAAHKTLPLQSLVEVTNLENGRKLVVRVNDRGPFVDNRIIDMSREAARQLGYEQQGITKVRVRYVGPAPLIGQDQGLRYAEQQAKPKLDTTIKPTVKPNIVLASGGPSVGSSLAPAVTQAAASAAPIAASAAVSQGLSQTAGPALSTLGTVATVAPLVPIAVQTLAPVATAPVNVLATAARVATSPMPEAAAQSPPALTVASQTVAPPVAIAPAIAAPGLAPPAVTVAPQISAPPVEAPVSVAASAPVTVQAPEIPAPKIEVRSASTLRVQAGAFASKANAERAVNQLVSAGQATIEPMTRADGVTLYRVFVSGAADEAEAYALRDRVEAIGFAGAQVVRLF